jgi:2',3'-cyclic-nucleotide 2'-phosphodiesterase (5'-nucleotidase family)
MMVPFHAHIVPQAGGDQLLFRAKFAARYNPAMRSLILLLIASLAAGGCAAPQSAPETVTITIVGLNDVHGELAKSDDRGGLVSVSAYVDALRQARARDGGAVLLIDAGDMWQGTLESNLGEGQAVVAAYNALGVTAAAIGNHEFDFGPVGPRAIPGAPEDAPRGALRERAQEADFPLLAANLIDEATGRPVAWDNVYPSVMVEAAGVRVGIIGVMTAEALQTTIAANVHGLRVAPLAPTIIREAKELRSQGADVVIVTAHAGSRCATFNDPRDTSSCDMAGEIMLVAEAMPPDLIDHIVAGHVHQGIAHVVNGISITSAYSSTRAFSRTDLRVYRDGRGVADRQVFAPHLATFADGDRYEGMALQADPAVVDIAGRAVTAADTRKNALLGVTLTAPFELRPDVESAISNLMTEAMLDSFDADIAVHNVIGGIRNGLPAGELTYGDVYAMFPFDNLVTIHDISGADLRAIVARKAALHRKPGFAGMRAFISCSGDGMTVSLRLDDGREIADTDTVRVIANDFLALGGDDILTPAIPAGGLDANQGLPGTRDVLVQWFLENAGPLDPAQFRTHAAPKWVLPATIPESCIPEGI